MSPVPYCWVLTRNLTLWSHVKRFSYLWGCDNLMISPLKLQDFRCFDPLLETFPRWGHWSPLVWGKLYSRFISSDFLFYAMEPLPTETRPLWLDSHTCKIKKHLILDNNLQLISWWDSRFSPWDSPLGKSCHIFELVSKCSVNPYASTIRSYGWIYDPFYVTKI